MNVLNLTDSQLATLLTSLDCYAKHLECSFFVPDCQQLYSSVIALLVDLEAQVETASKTNQEI